MLPGVNVCVAYMVLFIIVSLKRILKHKLNTPFSKVHLCNYATKSNTVMPSRPPFLAKHLAKHALPLKT